MGKKVILGIFCGVVALGLIVCIVGFAMGGRTGSFGVQNGEWVFQNREGVVRLGRAPGWARNSRWNFFSVGGFWDWNWGYDYDYDYDYDYNYGNGNTNNNNAAPAQSRPSQGLSQSAPASTGEIRRVDIDIAAGIVIVKTGEEAGLQVDGPLEYTSYYDENTWYIESIHEQGLFWRNAAAWLSGRDVTTTFTITVPASLDELEVSVDAGESRVSGVNARTLNCETDAGSMKIENIIAGSAEFDVNAGEIIVSGSMVETECDLDCDAGQIVFEGEANGLLEASCSAGSIRITVPRPADYGWSAEAELGSVSIDGTQRSGGIGAASSGGNPGALPFYDLDCDLGEIVLNFS